MASMTSIGISDLEIAPPLVIKQAALDYAAALAASSQFQLFEAASARLKEDLAAQQAMRAYQEKQQTLQALLLLDEVSVEERADLERLRKVFLDKPAAIDYLEAEANLRTLCQETAKQLSQMIDYDFVAACSTGCC
jgi:cell fate (sporulation/competence/biofilm development) regulator YlbF (YheA/YmcA/DUF963 family)